MSLRNRLIILLSVFAAFAIAAASATIYGVRLYVEDAAADFGNCMDQTREVDHLRLGAREQLVQLREILAGDAEATESYRAERDAFFTRLEAAARYAPTAAGGAEDSDWAQILRLTPKFRDEFEGCLALAQAGDRMAAADRLASSVEGDLWPALETRLQSARTRINALQSRTVNSLLSTNTQLLVLAALVAAFGAGLVGVGAALIRRWLILPVASLKAATQRLGQGDMAFRVSLPSRDELADLGDSLNHMAESLVAAQDKIHVSESKFRSLFENLRDAVLICDATGSIVEHHDGDRNLLRSHGADWRGKPLAELWPLWFPTEPSWPALLESTLVEERRTTAVDLEFKQPELAGLPSEIMRVDMVAYPVEYGRNRYAAIVLRDVSERHELQRRSRQAEAMKATISFAQGIAHDFNNLLTSGIHTLTRLKTKLVDRSSGEQAGIALQSCWQAARLARRLLDFAALDKGRPQTLRLSETVASILNALDESFFQDIRLHTDCHNDVLVHMDPDQLTQVVLNLVHNAREAMPDGGGLGISVQYAVAPHAIATTGPHTCALLTVEDTGYGMCDEVKQKLFEPFFSTKPRSAGRRRGLGLAVVYAVVRNAGGTLEVESQPGAGTRFSVFLPRGEGLPAAPTVMIAAADSDTPEGDAGPELVSHPAPAAPHARNDSSGSVSESR